MSTSTAIAARPAGSEARGDPFDTVWRAFTSPKLALFLMLGIAVAALAGALITQAPAEVLKNPDALRSWIGMVRPKYGVFTDLFQTLQFFSVFQSLWFRALLGLLAVNTVICTVNRFPGIWQAVMHPVSRPADGLFERGHPRETVVFATTSFDQARLTMRAALGRLHILESRDASGVYVYADQNRFARFGTLLSHAALVLVLGTAVVSGPLGYFEEPAFAVPVGSTREVGHNTNLSATAEDFVDEYYPETGQPKDYRTELVVYDTGREVARQTVRVNEPLIYGDVRFHQSSFGNAAAVTISQPGSGILFQDGVPFTWRSNDGQRPVGYVYLPGRDLHIYLVGTGGANDPLIKPGQLVVEAYQGSASTPTYRATLTQRQPQAIADLQIVFDRELQFTSLRVVRDPSAMLIWIASTLMVLGFCLAFYFPHRRVWARARLLQAGTAEVTLVGAGKETSNFVAQIANRLRGTQSAAAGSRDRPERSPTPPVRGAERDASHAPARSSHRRSHRTRAPTAAQGTNRGR